MSLLSFLLSIKRLEESPHVPFLISLYAFYIAAFFEVYLLAMVFGSNGRLLPQKKRWRASYGFDPVWLCELYSATKKRKSYLLITHLAVI